MRSSDHVRQRVRVRTRWCWLDFALATVISALALIAALQARAPSAAGKEKGSVSAGYANGRGF